MSLLEHAYSKDEKGFLFFFTTFIIGIIAVALIGSSVCSYVASAETNTSISETINMEVTTT